jgi:hypothetical protein
MGIFLIHCLPDCGYALGFTVDGQVGPAVLAIDLLEHGSPANLVGIILAGRD